MQDHDVDRRLAAADLERAPLRIGWQAAGVDTVRELKYRNPHNLAKAMAEANTKRKLVQLLPSEKAIERWIEHAKRIDILISY